MRSWIWIVPALFLAACSKPNAPGSAVQAAGVSAPSTERNPEPVARPGTEAPPAVVPVQREVVVPRGTVLRVRIDEAVNTRRNRAGDQFRASLAEPVVAEGKALLPKGTRFVGHVTESQSSGRLEGRAVLALTLDSFELGGKDYRVRTGSISRVSAAHKKRNFALIGGGAGLGALIGGLAGGGKGALIGSAAGAGAGTAGAAATGKKEIGVAAETVLSFPLRTPVQL